MKDMKRGLLVFILILTMTIFSSCAEKTAGTDSAASSIAGMNDISKIKIIQDQVKIRSGCSGDAPVLQTVSRNVRLDVISKVEDWYAIKLDDNSIGFVPEKQATPVVPDDIKPGTIPNDAKAFPGTEPGTDTQTAPGTENGKGQGTAPGANPSVAPVTEPGTSRTTAPAGTDTGKGTTPDANTNKGSLTAMEQEMLNLINQARAEANIAPLTIDMELTKVARIKSQDMIDNNYFSHNSPTYGSPFDMMKSFGINYVHAGENIAGNSSVQGAHDSLMNSPGHRKNILSTNYTHVGIGIQKGGPYGYMFTQMFISKPK